jgi:hypothetical protein
LLQEPVGLADAVVMDKASEVKGRGHRLRLFKGVGLDGRATWRELLGAFPGQDEPWL